MTKQQFIKYINLYQDTIPLINGIPIYQYMAHDFIMRDHFNIEFYSVIEQVPESGFYERIFACKDTKKTGFVWQEVVIISEKFGVFIRNIFYLGSIYSFGFHVYGFDGKNYKALYYYGDDLPYQKHFEEASKEFPAKRIPRHLLTSVDDVIDKDQSLKYCAYRSCCAIELIDYISIYRKYPIAEMLQKLKIDKMYTDRALEEITKNKQFRTWIYKNSDSLHWLSFNDAFNCFKKNPEMSPREYRNKINKKIECAKKTHIYDLELNKKVKKYTTSEKLFLYLKKNEIGIHTYEDYIKACDWLQLDFSDTKVLFPKNFREMHDNYTKQYYEYHEMLRRRQVRADKKAEKAMRAIVETKMAETAASCNFLLYHDKNYKVLVAKTKKELIEEGAALNHCVGRMDYDKRQAEGKSVICFIRKYGDLKKSFVTVEVDCKTLKVLQCYGNNDTVVPEIDCFVRDWISFAKTQKKNVLKEVA